MLPPLAILVPRIIRVLELLVELYGIFAPCVGCALRGCFGGCFGCGRDKKPDCDCPPKEWKQERNRLCSLGRKREGKEKVHREGCPVHKREGEGQGEGTKRHWWQFEKKGKTLKKSPPPSRGFDLEGGEEEEDAELQVLQRQYSSLPQPPTPPPAVAVVA